MTTRDGLVHMGMVNLIPSRRLFGALNRVVAPLARGGTLSPPPLGGGVVVLETTGRRSGKRREVPLLATRVGDRLFVSTVRSDSQWVRNAEADSSVGIWLNGYRRAGTATVRRGPIQLVEVALDEAVAAA